MSSCCIYGDNNSRISTHKCDGKYLPQVPECAILDKPGLKKDEVGEYSIDCLIWDEYEAIALVHEICMTLQDSAGRISWKDNCQMVEPMIVIFVVCPTPFNSVSALQC